MPDMAGRPNIQSAPRTSGSGPELAAAQSSAVVGKPPTQRMPGAEFAGSSRVARCNPLSSSTTMTGLGITEGETNAAPRSLASSNVALDPGRLGGSGIGFKNRRPGNCYLHVFCSSNPSTLLPFPFFRARKRGRRQQFSFWWSWARELAVHSWNASGKLRPRGPVRLFVAPPLRERISLSGPRVSRGTLYA